MPVAMMVPSLMGIWPEMWIREPVCRVGTYDASGLVAWGSVMFSSRSRWLAGVCVILWSV